MFTIWGPIAGSFQHTPWPRRRASAAAILVSHAFAFIFSWYKVIIALSLCLSSGALQHIVHTSIIAAKTVSPKFFFQAPIFRSRLEARPNKNSNINPVSTKCRLQTADCRLGAKCRLRIYTVFFVWYMMKSHLTTYWGSHNCFSTIIFRNYLHCCGIFLAHFLITVVLKIILSLHIVFSLCTRVGWCDFCREPI